MAAKYEFRVHGHLGPMLLEAFSDLDAEVQGKFTLLRGIVRDQAALRGILAQIEALGLELVDMRQLTDD
jgi:hypothetical protein